MTIRDFSSDTWNNLIDAIDARDNSGDIFDWGIFDAIADLFISEDIANYQYDIERYHAAIVDKKNTDAAKLKTIFENVATVDTNSATTLEGHGEELTRVVALIQSLADTLNPSAPGAGGVPALVGFNRMGTMERAYDLWMQAEILKLYDTEPFREEDWPVGTDSASEARRQEILTLFLAEVQAIMGTNALPDIIWTNTPASNGTINWGSYRHSDTQVTVNLAALNDPANGHEFLTVIVHELRHAYQFETIDNPGAHNVSAATRSAWEWNLTPGNYVAADVDFTIYQQQPVEWDAKGFARQSLDGLTANFTYTLPNGNDTLQGYEGSWPDE